MTPAWIRRTLTTLAFSAAAVPAAPSPSPSPPPTLSLPQAQAQAQAGGWSRADPDSPPVRAAAGAAVQYLSEQFGRQYVVAQITDAEQQAVSGTDYDLKLRLVQVDGGVLGTHRDCDVKVWSKPWLESAKVTSFTCEEVERAAGQGGGLE